MSSLGTRPNDANRGRLAHDEFITTQLGSLTASRRFVGGTGSVLGLPFDGLRHLWAATTPATSSRLFQSVECFAKRERACWSTRLHSVSKLGSSRPSNKQANVAACVLRLPHQRQALAADPSRRPPTVAHQTPIRNRTSRDAVPKSPTPVRALSR